MAKNSVSSGTPLWVKGDFNGFFGLFTNVLTNILVFSSLMIGVLNMPLDIVYGRILPAVGLSQLFGSLALAYMAKKMSIRTKRSDVTALPYGLTVTNMFIITFLVMGPILQKTGDPMLAWSAGLAWCFIEGVIETLGAFVGPALRKVTPRAALLGTLSGLALTWIAMKPTMQVFNVPYLGFIGFTVILLGFFANKVFPFNLPAGLVSIILCTIIAWATGYMRLPALVESTQGLGFFFPIPVFKTLINGFPLIAPYLVSAIPLGVANFFETMSNLESASAVGDEYNTRDTMLIDGFGTMIGALFGSPVTTSVYIGHPGWKKMGAGIGYSIATGVSAFVLCILGIAPVLLNVIPLEALVPILIYIGLVIGAQAFQSTPSKHAPAVIVSLLPWLANWGQGLVDDALNAAGTNAQEVGMEALGGANILYEGMRALGSGTIIAGLILGAIVTFLIDDKLKNAAMYAGAGAILSFFGIIHAPALGIGAASNIAIGYALMVVILLLTDFYNSKLDNKLGDGLDDRHDDKTIDPPKSMI